MRGLGNARSCGILLLMMRNSLALTGLNLGLVVLALVAYFGVGAEVAMMILFAGLILHTVRPFLQVLEAADRDLSASAPVPDELQLLARISQAQQVGGDDSKEAPFLFDTSHESDVQRRVDRARRLIRTQKSLPAQRVFEQLTVEYPNEPSFWHNLGLLQIWHRETKSAWESFGRSLGLEAEAGSSISKIAAAIEKKAPDAAGRAYSEWALLCLLGGKTEEVMSILPSLPSESDRARFEAWVRLSRGEGEQAGPLFERVLAEEPGDRPALLGSGLAAILAGRLDDALPFLDGVISQVRSSPASRPLQGAVLGLCLRAYAIGEFARIKRLTTALREFDPDHRGTILLQSIAALGDGNLQRSGEEAQAMWADLNLLFSLDPDSVFLAYVLGRAHLLLGEPAQARSCLEQVTGEGTDSIQFSRAKALALLGCGESDLATKEVADREDWPDRLLRACCQMSGAEKGLGLNQMQDLATQSDPPADVFAFLTIYHSKKGTEQERLREGLQHVTASLVERPSTKDVLDYLLSDPANPFI